MDSSKGTRCHLTLEERWELQGMLDKHLPIRSIAKSLGRNPSTILREIKRHATTKSEVGTSCHNKANCNKKHVCGSMSCNKKCKNCSHCKKYCTDYIKVYCDTLQESPYLCNGCNKISVCNLERHFYRAYTADADYRATLTDRRSGYDLTGEELEDIDKLVTPLLMQGLSPYHIKQTLGDQLKISESTLRRLISNCELNARNIDLRQQVKRKPRTHANHKMKKRNPCKRKDRQTLF